MISAWFAANPVATWFALHPMAKTAAQGAITLAFGCGVVIAQHFLRRYLKRNWPDDGPAQTGAPIQQKALAQARRVDWFALGRRVSPYVRRVVSRLKAKRGAP